MDAKKTGHGGHGPRSRNVCFTAYGTRPDFVRLLDPEDWPHCTYLVYQLEQCKRTGRLHLQGYAEFDSQMSFQTLHTYAGLETAHFEARRGTQKQAMDYCKKEDSHIDGPWMWGEPKHQGRRQELIAVAEDLAQGQPLHVVAKTHPAEFMQYPSGISKLALMHAAQRSEQTVCFVFYGAGGTGKTTFAHKLASYLGTRTYVLPAAKGSGLYWDGYQQGDVVIIDEFKGNRMQPTEFNMLVDKVPHQVPIHGGTAEFNSRYIIITTNVSPLQWWPTLEYKRSLRRRIVLWPIFRNLGYKKPVNVVGFHHCATCQFSYFGTPGLCLQCTAKAKK